MKANTISEGRTRREDSLKAPPASETLDSLRK